MGLCVVNGCYGDARHRYACERCTERMRKHLREIEHYATIIRHTKTRGPAPAGGRHAPGYGPRSPGDDTKITADDYRSRSTGDGLDDREHDTPSLLGTLAGINRWIRETQDTTQPRTLDLNREIGWLLTQIEWCASQPWVDDVADNIRELHTVARTLAGDRPAGPVGKCLGNCGGTVFPSMVVDVGHPLGPRVEGGRCNTCDLTYDWLQLIQVRRLTT